METYLLYMIFKNIDGLILLKDLTNNSIHLILTNYLNNKIF